MRCPFHQTGSTVSRVEYQTYLRLPQVLNAVQPETRHAKERLFIRVHQLCEILFAQIRDNLAVFVLTPQPSPSDWRRQFQELTALYEQLFGAMQLLQSNMSPAEFFAFRDALKPASGFQSLQYRQIELALAYSVDFLIPDASKHKLPFGEKLNFLYWRQAFPEESPMLEGVQGHQASLLKTALQFRERSLGYRFYHSSHREALEAEARAFDKIALDGFKKCHFRLANTHLSDKHFGTGGSHWKTYLNLRNQNIQYFKF